MTLDYRLLVLDLDGTALTREHRITDEDVAAAGRLHDAGVQITIATGRLFTGALGAIAALPVEGHVAVMNGSEHVHSQTGDVRHRWGVDIADRLVLREVLGGLDLEAFVFTSERIHHGTRSSRHTPYLRFWTDRLEAYADVLEASAWDQGQDVLGVCAAGAADDVEAALESLEGRLSGELELVTFHTFSGERFLQVRHRHEDKGTALARLAEERGTTAAQTVAVGDWLNDVPMLRAAGRGLVMSGADPVAEAAADGRLVARRGEGGAIAEVARVIWGV